MPLGSEQAPAAQFGGLGFLEQLLAQLLTQRFSQLFGSGGMYRRPEISIPENRQPLLPRQPNQAPRSPQDIYQPYQSPQEVYKPISSAPGQPDQGQKWQDEERGVYRPTTPPRMNSNTGAVRDSKVETPQPQFGGLFSRNPFEPEIH